MSENNNNSNRKRFQGEQIRYLERVFEEEARPEHHVKQQLADRLGLLPRQVAIWFQNKRARCKTRHIEQECNLLKANYDGLASKCEALKKDNHSLQLQVKRLRQLSGESSIVSKGLATQDYVEKGDYLEEECRVWNHACNTSNRWLLQFPPRLSSPASKLLLKVLVGAVKFQRNPVLWY